MFRHRTALPLPVAAAILLVPAGETPGGAPTILAGIAMTVLGEVVRLWGVHHIGVVSRTRSDRVGPLIETGPFRYVRNPLYIGNILLWAGFAVAAGLLWLAPIALALLAVEYHWIVRWEEALLLQRRGNEYRDYARRVPRWMPRFHHKGHKGHYEEQVPENIVSVVSVVVERSWRATFFSERGTLIAIAAGYLLLWLKARF